VAADPDLPNLVYALTQLDLWVFNGVSWTPRPFFGGVNAVQSLGDGSVIVVASPSPFQMPFVFRSEDGGSTWEVVLSVPDFRIMSESYGSRIYIISDVRLFRSDDGGSTWISWMLPDEMADLEIFALDFSPLYPDTVYCACGIPGDDALPPLFRIYRSEDGGETWSLVFEDTTGSIGGCDDLEVKPTDPSTLVMGIGITHAAEGVSLLISEDGGSSWTPIFEGMLVGAIGVSDVEFNGDTLYIATHLRTGLFKAYPFFGTWLFSTLDTVHLFYDIDITPAGVIYASYSGGVMRILSGTMDDISLALRGVSFQEMWDINPMQVSRYAQSELYAVDSWLPMIVSPSMDVFFTNMVYHTSNAGNSWTKKPIPNLLWAMSVNTSANHPEYVYVSGLGLELSMPNPNFYMLYRSTDGGNTFEPVCSAPHPDSAGISLSFVTWVSPTNPDELLLYTFQPEKQEFLPVLMKSDDGGRTFSTVLTGVFSAIDGTDTVYTVTIDTLTHITELAVSYDRGSTWNILGPIGDLVFITHLKYAPSLGKLYLIGMGTTSAMGLFEYDLSTQDVEMLLDLSDPTLELVNLDIDESGRPFVVEILMDELDSTTISLMGRMDLDGTWEFDTLSPTVMATGVVASDTMVFALTVNHGVYTSSDAAFSISEHDIVNPLDRLGVSVVYHGNSPYLKLNLPYAMVVDLKVFDVSGRLVFRKDFGLLNKGAYEVELPGLRNGLYFYQLAGTGHSGKFMLVK